MSDSTTQGYNITQIDGDVSVGRNVAMGGKAQIAGSVTIGHNLKVKGWLEADNVKDVNKGIFSTLAKLQETYPTPHDGWFAGVGDSTPFDAYIGEDGAWVSTGGTIDVEMSAYSEEVEQLADAISDILAKLGAAGGIATLDSYGKLMSGQIPGTLNPYIYIRDNALCISSENVMELTAMPIITSETQSDGTVVVTIECSAINEVVILYSLDGSTPSIEYETPFTLSTAGTFSVKSTAQEVGKARSSVSIEEVTVVGAGTITIAKDTASETGTTSDIVATCSNSSAIVTLSDGTQTASGTGSASLTISKGDSSTDMTFTATAAESGKVSTSATATITIGALPNSRLKGLSTAPVTDIYLGSDHYTNESAASNGMQIINTANGDGTYTWELNFGTNIISTLARTVISGTANIFGGTSGSDTVNTQITAITKIPDCVTELGNNAFRWCSNMTTLNITENISRIASSALVNVPAQFEINKADFYIGSIGQLAYDLKGTHVTSFISEAEGILGFYNCVDLQFVIMPKCKGTYANNMNCRNCTSLKYIELGDPTPVNGVYYSKLVELRQTFIDSSSALEAVVLYESNPSKMTLTKSNDVIFDNIGTNVRFYVPDDKVNDYKIHEDWSVVADRIYPLSQKPDLQDLLTSNNS